MIQRSSMSMSSTGRLNAHEERTANASNRLARIASRMIINSAIVLPLIATVNV